MKVFLAKYSLPLLVLGAILGIFFKSPLVFWLCFLGGAVIMVRGVLAQKKN